MGNTPPAPPACVGLVASRNCSTSCDSGQRSDGTSCWEDAKTTCKGGYVSRHAPVTCPSDRELDELGLYCYEKCRDGYEKRPGDVISCWNTKPTTRKITDKKPSIPTCAGDDVLEASLCYIKGRDDYTCKTTTCELNNPSYVPRTYDKKSYDRGIGEEPKKYDPIPCGTNCCSFDLTFINNNFSKPNQIKMLIYSIPLKDELFAYYNADSFSNGIWYDLSTNSNNAVYLKGNIRKVNNYITGDVNSTILFPFDVLPDEYTIFHVCKYNGKSKGKILSGYQSKWSSGFASGLSGVAIHDTWITQSELSVFDDKWVFSTDTNNSYRANMNDYTTVQKDFKVPTQLSINLNDLPEENSDWAIACIIVFERRLSLIEIDNMERWLTNKYSYLWSQTYYKTFKQLGYGCFDNKIGKITNNYTKYEFAGYNGEKIDCKWLNYPQKKQIDGLSCASSSSYPRVNAEEGFKNTITSCQSVYNYLYNIIDFEFIVKLIIVIIILLIVMYSTKKNYKKL